MAMGETRSLVQMSGVPGSGKSTLAEQLVRHRRLVRLDHDVVKSSIMAAGIAFDTAGRISYTVLYATADALLTQGFGVVIDSPCFYDEVLAQGQALAERHAVAYRYIECVTEDLDLLDRRLRTRTRRPSQRPAMDDADLFRGWIAGMKRPAAFLRLDTTRSLDDCVADALSYIDSAGVALGPGRPQPPGDGDAYAPADVDRPSHAAIAGQQPRRDDHMTGEDRRHEIRRPPVNE